MKQSYKYRIQLNRINGPDGEVVSPTPIDFQFESHDDIFRIMAIQEEAGVFGNRNHTSEFALGVKLLGGVILKYKECELFSDFQPAFTELLKKLNGGKMIISIRKVYESD